MMGKCSPESLINLIWYFNHGKFNPVQIFPENTNPVNHDQPWINPH